MKAEIKNFSERSAKVVITGVFEDVKELGTGQKIIDEKYNGCLSKNVLNNFEGKFKESLVFPAENGDKILVLGFGKTSDFSLKKLREAISKNVQSVVKYAKNGVIAVIPPEIDKEGMCKKCVAASCAMGVGLGEYKYDKYKKSEGRIETVQILTDSTICDSGDAEKCKGKLQAALNYVSILINSMNFTKDMIFEPAENMTPNKVVEIAHELANEKNLQIKIFNKQELKEMNFNTFLAVGQGSVHEPKFIHITYKPENPKKKIALIGKGITFDSGGLDIKPASSMLTMKTDMSGAATVLGVMKAIAEIKPDVELHVMSALCENMPSGSSYKVGDIIVSKSGKTIEVDNTDAEGRLTLADVLTYADSIGADEVIDIATLTGAVIVALGHNITGIMGNNQEMIDSFKASADKMGENVWQLPMFDDMAEGLKSDVADMKNTGPRFAGSSVAGRFLSNFTKSKNWLHIDIAGTAYIEKPYGELQKGATAAMLRSLVSYIAK